MRHLSSEAIILHAKDYAEWDRIVSVYTRDYGKLTGIAKGAKRSRKRFGSALEPFTHNELFFVEKESQGLVRFENCHILNLFTDIAGDLRKVVYGSYFLELVHTLTAEKEKNAEIFSLLLFFINLLQTEEFREDLMRIFELRFFTLLGYQPEFLNCISCGRAFRVDETYRFSVRRGGIVCSQCRGKHADLLPLSNGTIRIFQQAQTLALLKINRIFFSPSEHAEGRLIFGKFLEYHAGRRPKSLDLLNQLGERAGR